MRDVYPDTRHTGNNVVNAEILVSKHNMENFLYVYYVEENISVEHTNKFDLPHSLNIQFLWSNSCYSTTA